MRRFFSSQLSGIMGNIGRTRTHWLLIAAVAGCVVAAAQSAHAAVIRFEAAGLSGGSPVDAMATITTGANSLSVVLTNLEASPTSIGESISGLLLDFSSTPTSAALLGTPSGELVDLVGSAMVPVKGSITRWSASQSSGTVILTAIGGGQPTQLIIGPGPYSDSTGGFGSHQPHVLDTASFSLKVNGISSTVNVTSARIAFGTGADSTIVGKIVRTPEPISLVLLGSGVVVLGLCRRKLRLRSAHAAESGFPIDPSRP
jgi:hypothetical protein